MAERRAAELRGEITDTDTRVNNYGDDDQPLPKGARIRFELLPDTGSIRRSIQVHAEGGELVIQGDYSVEIMPHSSNYFSVRMRR
jgi:hypothetical protein